DPVWFRTAGAQKGRDGARVPLPWRGEEPPYGFGESSRTWLPQPLGWQSMTVAAEEADPTSTLHQYRDMLRLRHELTDLESGSLLTTVRDGDVLVIQRGERFTCVVNMGHVPAVAPISGAILVASDAGVTVEGDRIALPPSTGAWIRC
ncbi:MAG: DUF3459 domain-containing protein, partial [Candidatus Nanopelagicales bacterium]|nr:DUF3459 domain-containing protein [Candidatus Nanopelagicales bacterium]